MTGISGPEPQAVGAHRRAGLADLYRQHGPGAVRLAYVLTGDRVFAEDLAQDAFVKVSTRFQDLRDPAAFAGYLRRAVVNLCNSHFRRKRVERAFLRTEPRRPAAEEPPDLGTRDALRAALLALPIRQRTALALRYYEDLSEQEAARAMGCSPGAVKSLVARGVQTLRIDMEEEER